MMTCGQRSKKGLDWQPRTIVHFLERLAAHMLVRLSAFHTNQDYLAHAVILDGGLGDGLLVEAKETQHLHTCMHGDGSNGTLHS